MSLMHPKDNHLITTYCGECQTESTNNLPYRHIMKVHRSFYTRKVIDENGHVRRRSRTSKYGLGDENDVSEKHHVKCKKCDNTSEATKAKENHMDNKLSSYKTRIGSDGNLGYHRKSKRRKVKLKKVDSGNEAEMSGIN